MAHHLSHSAETRSDHELLDDFLRNHESEAFAYLVARHGPMILGVCRRILHHQADAEDAFQATFLTLLRKGHSIRRKMALPNWLYRVAVRISLRQRAKAQKHAGGVPLLDVAAEANPADEIAWREAADVIDRELHSLPESYRSPLLLCCLEGRSYEEAAAELGCPVGTLAVRLLRGREMLRKRLVRRGLVLGAGFLAAQAVWPQAQAAVSHQLSASTVAEGQALLAGRAARADIPKNVRRLLETETQSWRRSIRGTVLALALGGVSLLVVVFVVTIYFSERRFQASTYKVDPGMVVPQLPPQPQQLAVVRPQAGMWVGRWDGANVRWAPFPGLGQGPIVEVMLLLPNLRVAPGGNMHEGYVVLVRPDYCFSLLP